MPVARVVVAKQAPFKGKQEEFSNVYHFETGTQPFAYNALHDLAHAVLGVEVQIHATLVSFVYLLATMVGVKPAIFTEPLDGSLHGIQNPSGVPGEVCVLAESKLRNRVYMRKFYHLYHATAGQNTGLPDTPRTDLTPDINAALVPLTDGSMPGTVRLCTEKGIVATEPLHVAPYLVTRQFKRPGKRRG